MWCFYISIDAIMFMSLSDELLSVANHSNMKTKHFLSKSSKHWGDSNILKEQ